uniref:Uncharacterized protein n=1 Tax=Anopheles melas TaxID=34690 RepID=A0A182TZ60_9DIPT
MGSHTSLLGSYFLRAASCARISAAVIGRFSFLPSAGLDGSVVPFGVVVTGTAGPVPFSAIFPTAAPSVTVSTFFVSSMIFSISFGLVSGAAAVPLPLLWLWSFASARGSITSRRVSFGTVLISSTTFLCVSVVMFCPFTSMMRSPWRRPADSAGEPSSTLPMYWPGRPFSACRLNPYPSKSARFTTWQRRASYFGVVVAPALLLFLDDILCFSGWSNRSSFPRLIKRYGMDGADCHATTAHAHESLSSGRLRARY